MLHHPQVKAWIAKEDRIRQNDLIVHRPERPDKDAAPEAWARYQCLFGEAREKEAKAWNARKSHNRRWKNIQRHLQHRQNATLLV